MEQEYEFIKLCFTNLLYNSVYPFVNKLELSNFCELSKLIDKNLNLSNCDLLFVSSEDKKKYGVIKKKAGLIRCEFLEYLVRLANFKYVQTGIIPKISDAVKHVINDWVKPNFTPLPWQDFR